MPEQAYKRCSRCGETKPLEGFGRNRSTKDGLQSRCRPCKIAEDQETRKRNPERNRRANRVYAERYPERKARQQREWRAQSPDKKRAHDRVHKAIARGALIRPDVCSRCGAGGNIQAHHADYSKPLEVTWLCPSCHGEEHSHNE